MEFTGRFKVFDVGLTEIAVPHIIWLRLQVCTQSDVLARQCAHIRRCIAYQRRQRHLCVLIL